MDYEPIAKFYAVFWESPCRSLWIQRVAYPKRTGPLETNGFETTR